MGSRIYGELDNSGVVDVYSNMLNFTHPIPYCTGLRIITCMWISPHGDWLGVFAGQPRHQFLTDCQRNTYTTLTKGYRITYAHDLSYFRGLGKLKAVFCKIPGLNPVSGFAYCHAINSGNSELTGVQHNRKA